MAAHEAPPSLGLSRQEHWSGLPFPSPMQESEKWKGSRSVVSDSSRPHGLQPTRLLRPWDFPGKSTGVGCHCLLRHLSLRSYKIVILSRLFYFPNLRKTYFEKKGNISLFILFFYDKFIYFNWKLITLQYCVGFAIHQHESATGIHVFLLNTLIGSPRWAWSIHSAIIKYQKLIPHGCI